MTVCLFGNYIKDYPRISTMRDGFKLSNARVLECHTRKTGIKKYLDLYKQHKKLKKSYDVLLVTMGGYTLVWFAKLLSNKKIIFDAFTSLYLTNVEDRKNCSSKSFKAKYYKFLDRFSCKLADLVLLDTTAQINYYIKQFGLPKDKFLRVFISADDEVYFPIKLKENKKFIVHWHGHIVPFHSVETIIHTAKLLKEHPDIEFQIITRFNNKYKKIKNLAESLHLKNIKFYPETSYPGIARSINNSDVCLGVFGNNKKAQVVIPNKIIEAVACAKPVITGKQEVLFELFEDNKNILMVAPESGKELANKILELKKDPELMQKIGQNSYKLFTKKLKSEIVIQDLINILQK